MVAYNEGLVVDFGSFYGEYYYNGTTWDQLSSANPEWLAVYVNEQGYDTLVSDFGSAYGLHQYDPGSHTWSQIAAADPDNTGNTMVAYGNGLAVDFGNSYGMWYYDVGWWNMTPADPEWLGVHGDKLPADFGANLGIWEFEGSTSSWSKIDNRNADNTDNTMVDVNF